MKESKSMLEVWEWKDAVYNDIKGMTKEEKIRYFKAASNDVIKEMGYKKKKVGKNIYILVKGK